MSKNSKKNKSVATHRRNGETITVNRSARFHYELDKSSEAGVELMGSEVKSLRKTGAHIADAYIEVKDSEAYLVNADIAEYNFANRYNHYARRPRKLLLHRREINRLQGAVEKKGLSVIPLRMYFTSRGWVKIAYALGKGKKQYDKRHAIKKREWERSKERIFIRNT